MKLDKNQTYVYSKGIKVYKKKNNSEINEFYDIEAISCKIRKEKTCWSLDKCYLNCLARHGFKSEADCISDNRYLIDHKCYTT